MNRQIRRAEEKKERKAEREKAKVKAERQARRRQRRQQRVARAEARAKGDDKGGTGAEARSADAKAAGPQKSNPGRFSGALMAATIFFIALQTVAPTDGTLASQAVAASFYLLFGYFATLWMKRRDAARPLLVAIVAGVMMTIATAASQAFQPTLELAPIMLALSVPAVVAGAFLGRLVWNRAP